MSETAPLLIALSLVGACFSISYFRPPEWADKIGERWKILTVASLLSSIVVTAIFYMIFEIQEFMVAVTSLTAVGFTMFLLTQTLFTDFMLRLADRRLFNYASIVSFALTFYVLYSYNSILTLLAVTVFSICLLALLPFPKLLNKGDTRALIFIVVTSIPMIGFEAFQLGVMAFLAMILIYAFYKAIRKPKEEKESFFHLLLTRISIPAVPFILAPFIPLYFLSYAGMLS